jgi:hypothetical protein
MNLERLEKELNEALITFSEEIRSNISCASSPRETLNYYDYEELARQTFYCLDTFKTAIIKYLEKNK